MDNEIVGLVSDVEDNEPAAVWSFLPASMVGTAPVTAPVTAVPTVHLEALDEPSAPALPPMPVRAKRRKTIKPQRPAPPLEAVPSPTEDLQGICRQVSTLLESSDVSAVVNGFIGDIRHPASSGSRTDAEERRQALVDETIVALLSLKILSNEVRSLESLADRDQCQTLRPMVRCQKSRWGLATAYMLGVAVTSVALSFL